MPSFSQINIENSGHSVRARIQARERAQSRRLAEQHLRREAARQLQSAPNPEARGASPVTRNCSMSGAGARFLARETAAADAASTSRKEQA